MDDSSHLYGVIGWSPGGIQIRPPWLLRCCFTYDTLKKISGSRETTNETSFQIKRPIPHYPSLFLLRLVLTTLSILSSTTTELPCETSGTREHEGWMAHVFSFFFIKNVTTADPLGVQILFQQKMTEVGLHIYLKFQEKFSWKYGAMIFLTKCLKFYYPKRYVMYLKGYWWGCTMLLERRGGRSSL